MLRQVIELINPDTSGGVYLDLTVGMGGHSKELLKYIGETGKLICIDRDEESLKIASERLKDKRCSFHKAKSSELSTLLSNTKVDGILLDLGISMFQLKDSGRGFSFLKDEPLDMRMNGSQALTAEKIVNSYPEKELMRILKEYGEERLSFRIAKNIVKQRPIRTSRELAGIVESVYGGRGRIHPATKTFQALRIAVNNELDELNKALGSAIKMLNKGGRLITISYHSLEDRLIKNFMKSAQKQGSLKVLTKKPITPDKDEIKRNPSSRSAKLRAGERL